MTNTTITTGDSTTEKISVEMLAKLTGFPIELIKEEVFKNQTSNEMSLDELRSAMLSYIDSTLLNNN